MAKISVDLGNEKSNLFRGYSYVVYDAIRNVLKIIANTVIYEQVQVITARLHPEDANRLVLKIVVVDPFPFVGSVDKFEREFEFDSSKDGRQIKLERAILNELVALIGCRQDHLSRREIFWRNAIGKLQKTKEYKECVYPPDGLTV